jgi:ribonuclease G
LNKELVIHSSPQGVQIALLEDRKLVELHNEKIDASFAVGDYIWEKSKN